MVNGQVTWERRHRSTDLTAKSLAVAVFRVLITFHKK